ncbi:undecaprenyldiphospho-muramoylpentapeptide beta-N-acetylglucosaminyltransferase [Paracrocinitomix mangrovi]|uniref:undecaprenyldiphospho-muramoylpentapeptide beta-N-acetylglucosaminyltransferase n=1 Tax=Paracrocinitomix mangrovi TaxID=2862509 RepID=UPI001C8EEB43|nr:undecaprenyldiphospho-muramoylpentapeptide beta-N-acetylglucosaminyltransferase [Paracrocinitomix mangrovi]UKN03347.1 undecaprenyldiphospho-muramoylpentapeptide beta-N-acetylglucosaminyltransferase [Paracrocinitomix mangrovi]
MPLRKVIISGGGTGGHIFPAIAIANKIKEKYPDCEILFVGAEGKMEMEKVPKAGYKIVGLPIRGIQRKLSLKNLAVPFKLIQSLRRAKKIIKNFKPDIAIGVGGYASAATLRVASKMKIPTLIQEQNGYPGVTNKILGKRVQTICVAYDHLDRFFPKEKIVKTGNPVRAEVVQIEGKRESAFKGYNLNPNKKTILVIGGSLGARTLNESIQKDIQKILDNDFQLIWQCGSFYKNQLQPFVDELKSENIYFSDFIFDMDHAYAAADLIISRAGAISVSEVCLIGKPVILVPSPNVAEDHQTKNAMALVKEDAAVLVKDVEAREKLVDEAIQIMKSEDKGKVLSQNILKMGIADATDRILNEIEKLVK